ncbi:hypothetical protein HFO26_35660 [Rhizobium leguminosarum]|uniref:cytochrome P450 n=1 Tax=Rhizobium leguminosarum TaxID=384 RepID=UPI001C95C1FD|nr:cytochrome P450 [Rhizobium leguminosarum]MBY5735510.1 hypothetical protein [Rhizobium leguminosarum]
MANLPFRYVTQDVEIDGCTPAAVTPFHPANRDGKAIAPGADRFDVTRHSMKCSGRRLYGELVAAEDRYLPNNVWRET